MITPTNQGEQFLKKYDVVCTLGRQTGIIQTVEACDDKQAKDKVWNGLSDEQRSNCSKVEVFELSEIFKSITIS